MSQTLELGLERLKRLPLDPSDSWQLDVLRWPQWIVGEGREPYRPVMSLCRSVATGLVNFGDLRAPEEADERLPLASLNRLATTSGIRHRPARVEVRDPAIADALRPLLAEIGIELRLVAELPKIDEVYADMLRDMGGRLFSGYLEIPGVDVERLRAFAQAADEFHRAAPWNHLSDVDLIQIESAVPDATLTWFVVLGGAGIEYGIGFHPSRRDHDRLLRADDPRAFALETRRWLLTFDPIHDIPVPDADLWEAHHLPLAGERAYPFFLRHDGFGAISRPTAPVLTFAEALLRALAASTEDEFDRGRWSRTVATFDGERTLELALPALLEPSRKAGRRRGEPAPGAPDRRLMDRIARDVHRLVSERQFENVEEIGRFLASRGGTIEHRPPATPADRAQDLFYEALEAEGRMRIKLARESLREWPDCADAWVLLAEETPDSPRKAELYRKGVEAGERALGPAALEEHVGHFWGMVETRPYMRARFGLAGCLWSGGRRDEAILHWKELLRLNPSDNQGVRFVLVPRLLGLGRNDEARGVLAAYPEDPTPTALYSRALLEFRTAGEPAAQPPLEAAIKGNPHVIKFLLGIARPMDSLPDHYQMGSEEEAAIEAAEMMEAWSQTPGALEWLRRTRKTAKKARERRRSKARRR